MNKNNKKTDELGFPDGDAILTLNMRNLISKALSFYCNKYKRRFNFSEIGCGIGYGSADIHFKYDNREYYIRLTPKPLENASDQVDEMIKEADWNNDELVRSAVNEVKKTIN